MYKTNFVAMLKPKNIYFACTFSVDKVKFLLFKSNFNNDLQSEFKLLKFLLLRF